MSKINRREFLNGSAKATLGLSLPIQLSKNFLGRVANGGNNINMTLTAAPRAQQTLTGMGATMSPEMWRTYSKLPRATRLAMARMIWGEGGLGFRVCRLWNSDQQTPNGARMLSQYKMLYDDVNSVQPHMIWLCSCTGHPVREGFEAYAAHHAQVVADCKAGGLVFQYVGTDNEPDDPGSPAHYLPTRAAELVRDFRWELDKKGLQDIKIVAPDCANVDRLGMRYAENIKDDPAALADLASLYPAFGQSVFYPRVLRPLQCSGQGNLANGRGR